MGCVYGWFVGVGLWEFFITGGVFDAVELCCDVVAEVTGLGWVVVLGW